MAYDENHWLKVGHAKKLYDNLDKKQQSLQGNLTDKVGNVKSSIGEAIEYTKGTGAYNTSVVGQSPTKINSTAFSFVKIENPKPKYTVTLREYKASAGWNYIIAVNSAGIVTKAWGQETTTTITTTFVIDVPDGTKEIYVSSYDQTNNYIVIIPWVYFDIQSQIDGLTERFGDDYATDYHDEEDAIVTKAYKDRTTDTVTLVLITDTHERKGYTTNQTAKQGYVASKIAEKVGAKAVIHMGDVIAGNQSTKELNMGDLVNYWKQQNKSFVPMLYTVAHHEQYGKNGASYWHNDDTACTLDECIGVMGTLSKGLNAVYSDDKTCWYADIDNIRIIGLRSTSETYNAGFDDYVLSFLDTALNTNKKVAVFSHMPSAKYVNGSNGTVANGGAVIDKLNAHTAGVVGFFHGHTHWDNIHNYNSASVYTDVNKAYGGFYPYISTCCAMAVKVSEDTYCRDGSPTAYDRTVGEYSEYCFDIVNIHASTGKIKLFRFGAG